MRFLKTKFIFAKLFKLNFNTETTVNTFPYQIKALKIKALIKNIKISNFWLFKSVYIKKCFLTVAFLIL